MHESRKNRKRLKKFKRYIMKVHTLLLCFLLNLWLTVANSIQIPKGYTVIKVDSVEEIEEKFLHIINKKHSKVVFHIRSTGTYFTQRVQKYWDVEETFLDLDYEKSPTVDRKLLKIYMKSRLFKGLKNIFKKSLIPYVEFYFSDYTVEQSRDLLPISPCHNEINGEGSVVKMQLTDIRKSTPHGTIGVPKILQRYLSSGEADIETEDENLKAFSIKCHVSQGEIGQIFLSDTAFLNYNLWYRTRIYDPTTGRFSNHSKFEDRGRERMILKGRIGQWVCATNKMIQLQCFNVIRDITIADKPSISPVICDD